MRWKNLYPKPEYFEKLVLKSGLGWRKTQDEHDVHERDPKFFIQKPLSMMALWNTSSQPTATWWNQSLGRLQEARLVVPSMPGQ